MRQEQRGLNDILRAKAVDIQAAHNDLQSVQNDVAFSRKARADEATKAFREQQVRVREEYEHHLKIKFFAKINKEAELRAVRTQTDANR